MELHDDGYSFCERPHTFSCSVSRNSTSRVLGSYFSQKPPSHFSQKPPSYFSEKPTSLVPASYSFSKRPLSGPKHDGSEQKEEPLRDAFGNNLDAFTYNKMDPLSLHMIQIHIDQAKAVGLAAKEAANPLNPTRDDRDIRIKLNKVVPAQVIRVDGMVPRALNFDYIMEGKLLSMSVLPLDRWMQITAEVSHKGHVGILQYNVTQITNHDEACQVLENAPHTMIMKVTPDEGITWCGAVIKGEITAKFRTREEAHRFWHLTDLVRTHKPTDNLESKKYITLRNF